MNIHTNQWFYKKKKHLEKRAELRKMECTVEVEDLKKLFTQERCFYCNNNLFYDGICDRREIDRFNNNIGYTTSNCVMSCRLCNRIKGTIVKGDDKLRNMQCVINKLL